MSLSQLACESGKARWCLMQWTSAYSMAVLAAICRVSNRTNSLHPGFDKDKKKIRIFITRRCAKRGRYLYLNPFWYTATPNHRPGFSNLRQVI